MKHKRLLTFIAPALLLGGCGTANRGLESVHQPVVERNDYAFDVAMSGDGLAPGEAQRLGGWLTSLRVGYGDRIAVEDGSGGDDNGVRRSVAAQAARFGLLVSDEVPVTVAALTPGTARVIVSRMSASVPGCPDHSRVSGNDFNGNTWSNYGCATNSNLAAMVARPEDLVRGQPGSGTADVQASFKAIDTLRKAPPTGSAGLKTESSKGGN
ncbi:CpaD family pilus assembly protein [Sphingomonas sp.]|uniref:CpaD family pilus assembly protein n=1 Tax=Sphingomonas sp. TaxID=28214 RepID=UPI002BDEB8DC|nr:CpaD family pilus assembly protein [Sphingomonas sp.]HWK35851.1 CpaD family pilus assembly protein [Sphingomonas sp.]